MANPPGSLRRQFRLQATRLVAGSWAVDVLLLAGLANQKILPLWFAAVYLVVGALVFGAVYAAHRTGLNETFPDPDLSLPQFFVGLMMQLLGFWLWPHAAYFFLLQLFSVFAFGLLSLGLRQYLALLVPSTLMVLFLVEKTGPAMGFALDSPDKRLLLSLTVVVGLVRVVGLAVVVGKLRARLANRNAALAESVRRIEELAGLDELTGLPNRRRLMGFITEEMDRSRRNGKPFCLAIVDLDRFKAVNDGFGHLIGDEVLRSFAAGLREAARKTDRVGRYGGEEFIIVLTEASLEEARQPLDRVRLTTAALHWEGPLTGLHMTASIGVAEYLQPESAETLIDRAEEALMLAKAAGGNRMVAAATPAGEMLA
ncbi:GGDEF domain-containing protein [Oxalobacteraceae bacterium OM1]|nr:GGDEF domain-containing protein [Oxalobacteraceae bacterium OM1]